MSDDSRTVPDEALVERTLAGDERSFETLFGRHEPVLRARLRNVVSAPLRRKVSVSDILQEARLAAYQACASFEPRGDGSVRAWLLRIAELKAYEAIRRFTGVAKRNAAREESGGSHGPAGQLVGREPSPVDGAIAGEFQAALIRAMSRLPDDHREILNLVGVKGMSFVEAGERMARSREAVRKLYGRALSSFTHFLAAERGSDGE
jgi:RNA polymerase sigma-70 factor, ECF subfamily